MPAATGRSCCAPRCACSPRRGSRCHSAGSRSGAGVGAGTVYRHFPSKEILLEAVLAEHIEDLTTSAGHWVARAAPGDALFGFLLEMIERSAGRQHLCDALTADKGWPRATLSAAAQRVPPTGLTACCAMRKQAGGISDDVRADDLAALAVGGAALCSAHRDRAARPTAGTAPAERIALPSRHRSRRVSRNCRCPSVTKPPPAA